MKGKKEEVKKAKEVKGKKKVLKGKKEKVKSKEKHYFSTTRGPRQPHRNDPTKTDTSDPKVKKFVMADNPIHIEMEDRQATVARMKDVEVHLFMPSAKKSYTVALRSQRMEGEGKFQPETTKPPKGMDNWIKLLDGKEKQIGRRIPMAPIYLDCGWRKWNSEKAISKEQFDNCETVLFHGAQKLWFKWC